MRGQELINAAQDGQAVPRIAQQFNLTNDQAERAIAEMVPQLSRALEANILDNQGLAGLLRALSSGHHGQYADDPDLFSSDAVRADGDKILGHLFGSKQVSRAVAREASLATGIAGEVLRRLLPYLASLLMGSLANGSSSKFEDILAEIPGLPGGQTSPQQREIIDGPATPDYDDTAAPNRPPSSSSDPFSDIADVVISGEGQSRSVAITIRDLIGSMLGGGQGGGIMSWILRVVVLRFGWRILRFVLGRIFGR